MLPLLAAPEPTCLLSPQCWLPEEDCFCGQIRRHGLRTDICFWLYMHPKEYLRKNNTGKLLWQVPANCRTGQSNGMASP